jgi:lysophospholipase L1-like esterase
MKTYFYFNFLILFFFTSVVSGESISMNSYQAFLSKAASGEKVRICYLGGSITVGASTGPRKGINREGKAFDYSDYNFNRDSWRALTYKWLKDTYEVKPGQFEQVNVSIGATTSEHATFRLKNHVLSYQPDLVFIEFAVNDSGRGYMSQKTPESDGSIHRTMANIFTRLRNQNKSIAIFTPISTCRLNPVQQKIHWVNSQKASALSHIEICESFRVPYLDISKVYYKDALPLGLERDRLFDGDDNDGNFVHPSPQGHKAYAYGIIDVLKNIFTTGEFRFETAENDREVIPFPKVAKLVEAQELHSANPQWEVGSFTDRDWVEPSFKGEVSLFSNNPNVELEYEFEGTSIGAWVRLNTSAIMEVYIDGEKKGIYANGHNGAKITPDYFGRGNIWFTGLQPEKHVLRLVPARDQNLQGNKDYSMVIHALMIDQGFGETDDTITYRSIYNDKNITTIDKNKTIEDGFSVSSNIQSNGLELVEENNESKNIKLQAEDGDIWKSQHRNDKVNGRMIYFNVPEPYKKGQEPAVILEFRYLDKGSATFYLQYDSSDISVKKGNNPAGAFKTHPKAFTLSNSGEWKTVKYDIDDALFKGRQNNADIRLNIGKDKLLNEEIDLIFEGMSITKK